MREIKFRAWDFTENKMMDTSELSYGVRYNKSKIEIVSQKDCFIFMQFTGLKDKNGVEIYEGDYMLDGHSGRWAEVKFIKGAFVVEFDNEIQDLYDWTCECIIGNIYETKELLND